MAMLVLKERSKLAVRDIHEQMMLRAEEDRQANQTDDVKYGSSRIKKILC